MSFPIYILDDDSVFFGEEDMDHVLFWENTVAKEVSAKYKISLSFLLNIPYCQRRARIVGNKLYCGEKLSKKVLKNIEKILSLQLEYIFDEHETRLEIDTAALKAHINNDITIL